VKLTWCNRTAWAKTVSECHFVHHKSQVKYPAFICHRRYSYKSSMCHSMHVSNCVCPKSATAVTKFTECFLLGEDNYNGNKRIVSTVASAFSGLHKYRHTASLGYEQSKTPHGGTLTHGDTRVPTNTRWHLMQQQ